MISVPWKLRGVKPGVCGEPQTQCCSALDSLPTRTSHTRRQPGTSIDYVRIFAVQETGDKEVSMHRKERRASKACSGCRTRKVRCDVLTTGTPCSKCRVDGFECSVLERKKRRTSGKRNDNRRVSIISNFTRTFEDSTYANGAIAQHIVHHQIPHYPLLSGLTEGNKEQKSTNSPNNSRGIPLVSSISSSGKATPRLILPSLSQEDMQYLTLRGAFDLPPKPFLDILIANYFRVFHPFFPVVDKESFFLQYNGEISSEAVKGFGISLLLLHSIIFTSCAVSVLRLDPANSDLISLSLLARLSWMK